MRNRHDDRRECTADRRECTADRRECTADMSQFAGILLAAGKGLRSAPPGVRNKLLQPLPNGETVVAAAAKNLLAVLPTVRAVVRPGADAVAAQLRALGCE